MTDPGPLVDHHCHGLVTRDLDRARFEALMNEASGPAPLGSTPFDSMLGVAVRRWCAPVLDLEPHVPADDYLARRRALGADEVNRRLVTAAGIDTFLVDTGLTPALVSTPAELAGLCGGEHHEILRLEAVGEAVLASGTRPADFPDAVRDRVRESGAVGAKSVAAYRSGLGLPSRAPTDDEVVHALAAVDPARLAHPAVNGWLAWSAVELGLPLQVHVAYGDNDVDLAECDPLRMTAFLRATQDRGVPVLLLHNYPFHRNAAYLAQVFDHVYMDVGLATHNTGALSAAIVRESLELVPFGKFLFSSDAYGLAELYLLGAVLFRRGLARVLDELVAEGEMARSDADRVTRMVGHENASRVYGLGSPR